MENFDSNALGVDYREMAEVALCRKSEVQGLDNEASEWDTRESCGCDSLSGWADESEGVDETARARCSRHVVKLGGRLWRYRVKTVLIATAVRFEKYAAREGFAK